jgi:hypothetical protein
MNDNIEQYLLAIHGKLAPKTLEAARKVHNDTAGAPQNIAAARSLGDLSHMVYIPVDHSGPDSGEFLILDQWSSLEGINQFFADPHVQQGGAAIFSERDPVVWKPASQLIQYHFPAPAGRNDRFIGIVRGKVRSQEEGGRLHNALVGGLLAKARVGGIMSHEAYFRVAQPGSPEELEFFAVDVWYDGAGMQKLYEEPGFMEKFVQMFAGEPMATVWVPAPGQWVEW